MDLCRSCPMTSSHHQNHGEWPSLYILVFFPKAVSRSARRSSSSSNKHYGVLMDKMEMKPPLKEDTDTNLTDWRGLVRLEFRQSVINRIQGKKMLIQGNILKSKLNSA